MRDKLKSPFIALYLLIWIACAITFHALAAWLKERQKKPRTEIILPTDKKSIDSLQATSDDGTNDDNNTD